VLLLQSSSGGSACTHKASYSASGIKNLLELS